VEALRGASDILGRRADDLVVSDSGVRRRSSVVGGIVAVPLCAPPLEAFGLAIGRKLIFLSARSFRQGWSAC